MRPSALSRYHSFSGRMSAGFNVRVLIMRMRVVVNTQERYVASLPEAGYLSAHLNLSNRPKSGEQKRSLRVEGYDTSIDTENVSHSWPEVELALGDVVELCVLEDGNGTQPSLTRRTSESPKNLFGNSELASAALEAGQQFEAAILSVLKTTEAQESDEDAKKVRRAVGHLLAALEDNLYSPIWRRHPSLVPEAMRGELL